MDLSRIPQPESSIPVSVIDLSKRYDIYCYVASEERLYEDVSIVGIRTFQAPNNQFSTALIGGHIEIEARNGTRMMIPHIRIYMVCEHGSRPAYKVLRQRKPGDNDWV